MTADTIIALMATYGYLLVASLVTIEGMGIPVPGELTLVTAAAFAAQGHLSILGVILASSLGTVLGGSGGYWLGRTGGLAVVAKYGHWFGLTEARLNHARHYFDNHGVKTVLIARFVVLLRMIASILAGVAHMRFALFSLVNLIGGVLWSVVFGTLGYVFGENLPRLEYYLRRASAGGVILVVIAVGALVIWRWRRRQQQL